MPVSKLTAVQIDNHRRRPRRVEADITGVVGLDDEAIRRNGKLRVVEVQI